MIGDAVKRCQFHLRAVTGGQSDCVARRRVDLGLCCVGVGQDDRQTPRGDGGKGPIVVLLQDPLEDLPLPVGVSTLIEPPQLCTAGCRRARLLPVQFLQVGPLQLDREPRRKTEIEPGKTLGSALPSGR